MDWIKVSSGNASIADGIEPGILPVVRAVEYREVVELSACNRDE